MRKARDVLAELIEHAQPPNECPFVLVESRWPGTNWLPAVGRMPLTAYTRFLDKLLDLEERHPIVDWSDEPVIGQQKCVTLWMSDIAFMAT